MSSFEYNNILSFLILSFILKRTMVFSDSICSTKRVRTPNHKYAIPESCVTNTSKVSSGKSSTTTIHEQLGAGLILALFFKIIISHKYHYTLLVVNIFFIFSNLENVQPKYTNSNDIVLEQLSTSKRKASRIPLSPMNPGISQNHLTIY
jgi:hypothetical protein